MGSKEMNSDEVAKQVLDESHRARHRAGREANDQMKVEIAAAREAGNERRAVQLEECSDKRKAAFTRRLRKLEELERAVHLLRLGAAVRRDGKLDFKRQPPATLFQQFEHTGGESKGGLRDLYYDVIPRGFGSGKDRNYKKTKKRSSSRTTPWKSGEMGRKIRYIFREDALEAVDGNMLTNMGDDIVEAVECSRQLEALEKLSRANAGVYRHLILPLPHELTSEERAALLAQLVRPFRDLGLPFCAALHHPDKDGDERNFHAHVVVSLRPFLRLERNCWEFSASKRTWLNTPASIKTQRKFISRAFNRALQAAGHDTRWTSKSRRDRGEKSPGNNKKGAELSRAERKEKSALEAKVIARRMLLETARLARDVGTLAEAAEELDRCKDLASQALVLMAARAKTEVRAQLEVMSVMRAQASLALTALSQRAPGPQVRGHGDLVSERLRAVEATAATALSGLPPRLVEAVRKGVQEGLLFARQSEAGLYAVSANGELLKAWVACIKTDEGREYCRAIISELPVPGDDHADLPSIRMTRRVERAGDETDIQSQWLHLQGRGKSR